MSGAAVYTASGLSLAPDSEWDASVILSGAEGTEIGRARFDYAFGQDDLTAGAQIPLLDPALLSAIVLLAAASSGSPSGSAAAVRRSWRRAWDGGSWPSAACSAARSAC